jgi:hypothetical protein
MVRRDDSSRWVPAEKVKGLLSRKNAPTEASQLSEDDILAVLASPRSTSANTPGGPLLETVSAEGSDGGSAAQTRSIPSDLRLEEAYDRVAVSSLISSAEDVHPFPTPAAAATGDETRKRKTMRRERTVEGDWATDSADAWRFLAVLLGVMALVGGVVAFFLLADLVSPSFARQYSGQYRLHLEYAFRNERGQTFPVRVVETPNRCIDISHSLFGWKVQFLDRTWTGKSRELKDARLTGPVESLLGALQECQEYDAMLAELRRGSQPGSLELAFGDAEPVINSKLPPATNEQTRTFEWDKWKPKPTFPPGAIVRSQLVQTDLVGREEGRATVVIPARAGFVNVKAQLLKTN